MRIKNKLFPYPTLQRGNGIYKTATFDTLISYKIADSKCALLFEAHVNAPEIQELLKQGKATFAFHLECSRTYFRKMVSFTTEKQVEVIDGNLIDRKLEICPLIVATQEIENFSCSDFSEIYAGELVSFVTGDIIAIGQQQELTIIKEKDALKKLSSIFYVDAYADDDDTKFMTIDPEDKQIRIRLPKRDAARFSACKDEPSRKQSLFTAVYFPALMAVIELMKSFDGGQWADALWYIKLSEKGVEKGIGDVDSWQNRSTLEIAQVLFDYPESRFLKELADTFERDDETL